MPPGVRRRRYGQRRLREIVPLVRALREMGAAHGGKTPGQVALNWTIAKGTVPIPGAKKAKQSLDNAGALGWLLEPADVETLDRLSDSLS